MVSTQQVISSTFFWFPVPAFFVRGYNFYNPTPNPFWTSNQTINLNFKPILQTRISNPNLVKLEKTLLWVISYYLSQNLASFESHKISRSHEIEHTSYAHLNVDYILEILYINNCIYVRFGHIKNLNNNQFLWHFSPLKILHPKSS